MNDLTVYFTVNQGGRLPTKAYDSDAGWDLYTSRSVQINPGEAGDVHTDICLGLPAGWYANIKPRSSTYVRYGVHVVEGIVDAGFRGELFVQVINPDPNKTVMIPDGSRIAQVLFLPVPRVNWVRTEKLPMSERGLSGFGASGR